MQCMSIKLWTLDSDSLNALLISLILL